MRGCRTIQGYCGRRFCKGLHNAAPGDSLFSVLAFPGMQKPLDRSCAKTADAAFRRTSSCYCRSSNTRKPIFTKRAIPLSVARNQFTCTYGPGDCHAALFFQSPVVGSGRACREELPGCPPAAIPLTENPETTNGGTRT